MAQQFSALAVSPEELGLVPSGALWCSVTPVPRGSDASLFCPLRVPGMKVVHRHACRQDIHISLANLTTATHTLPFSILNSMALSPVYPIFHKTSPGINRNIIFYIHREIPYLGSEFKTWPWDMAGGITLGTPKLRVHSGFSGKADSWRDTQPIYPGLTNHLETLDSHHRNLSMN